MPRIAAHNIIICNVRCVLRTLFVDKNPFVPGQIDIGCFQAPHTGYLYIIVYTFDNALPNKCARTINIIIIMIICIIFNIKIPTIRYDSNTNNMRTRVRLSTCCSRGVSLSSVHKSRGPRGIRRVRKRPSSSIEMLMVLHLRKKIIIKKTFRRRGLHALITCVCVEAFQVRRNKKK